MPTDWIFFQNTLNSFTIVGHLETMIPFMCMDVSAGSISTSNYYETFCGVASSLAVSLNTTATFDYLWFTSNAKSKVGWLPCIWQLFVNQRNTVHSTFGAVKAILRASLCHICLNSNVLHLWLNSHCRWKTVGKGISDENTILLSLILRQSELLTLTFLFCLRIRLHPPLIVCLFIRTCSFISHLIGSNTINFHK